MVHWPFGNDLGHTRRILPVPLGPRTLLNAGGIGFGMPATGPGRRTRRQSKAVRREGRLMRVSQRGLRVGLSTTSVVSLDLEALLGRSVPDEWPSFAPFGLGLNARPTGR